MFVLLVGAEIYGVKHNIELGFPQRPSLADFVGHCEATFRCEVARVRPPNAPLVRFVIDSVKIFDDTLNRWVDLASPHQLVEWSQLYLFQPASADPAAVAAAAAGEESQAILQPPVRIRSPLDAGRGKEKFFFLFHDMDFNGNGHLNREEVQRIFNVMGCFEVSEKNVDTMFQQFDTNRDGVMSFAEFSKWMGAMPDIGEMLLRRSVEYWQSFRQRRPDIRDASEISVQERVAIEQYLERCRAAAAGGAQQARTRTIKEMEDERLLLDREEELRRARDSFKVAYGRDLGVPPTTFASNKQQQQSSSTAAAQQQQQQQQRTQSPVAADGKKTQQQRSAPFGSSAPVTGTPRGATTPPAKSRQQRSPNQQ